jgi:hypothetical protein
VTRNQEEAAALTYNMRNWRMGAMEAEEGGEIRTIDWSCEIVPRYCRTCVPGFVRRQNIQL